MLEVDLSVEPVWGESEDWQMLSDCAVAAGIAVTPYAVLGAAPSVSLSIRLADNAEVRALNSDYRGKDKPTNVLTFPMMDQGELVALTPRHSGESRNLPDAASRDSGFRRNDVEGEIMLGDIILAHETCAAEAAEKGIPLPAHVTHLIIHGTLHLLGHDHIEATQGDIMEALEVKALASLGLGNPYD